MGAEAYRETGLRSLSAILAVGAVLAVLALAGCGGGSSATDTTGSGAEEQQVPAGAVAVVSDVPADQGEVTVDELRHAIDQHAAQQKLSSAPKPGDPTYKKISEEALGELLDGVWIEGEAAELGLVATDREVEAEAEKIRDQNFKTEAQWHHFLAESKLTPEDVDRRVKLQLLSQKIQYEIENGAAGKAGKQQQFKAFVTAFQRKWKERTLCRADFVNERCSNAS
ncbi:MAG TPA: SurA N-terminal domain-containing protein [Solirubrobacterales bacterium]|nr:SurA N-terminal domain-containing protein [Solirubrobacterales bacterium]